jgi:hypothetical protein
VSEVEDFVESFVLYDYIGIGLITCEENNLKHRNRKPTFEGLPYFIMLMYYEFISV